MRKFLYFFLFFVGIHLVGWYPLYAEELSKSTIPQYKIDKPKPLLRAEFFLQQRAFPFEQVPFGARERALQYKMGMGLSSKESVILVNQPQWSCVGPYSIGGRVKAVAVHPQNPSIVYIGAAAGGIWKSTNSGQTWRPIFDYENSIAFGSISIDVNNPNVIYAGTGEAVPGGGNVYLGSGLYRSTDGGETWKLIGLTNAGSFSKVFVHPKNSNLIITSSINRKAGVYKSTDGGITFSYIFSGQVTDLSINPANENEYIIGVYGDGIYYTSDGGQTWERRNTGLDSGIGRISVQFAPSNPEIVYALMEISSIGTIYKSVNKGLNWSLSYRGSTSFFNNQGFYNNYIVVHPSNPNIVLAGGIDIFRTSNGGSSWSNVTYGYQGGTVHVDHHHACFDPTNPNIVYAGCDGGMYRSTDAGVTWKEINNGLEITQFYAMAIDHTKYNTNFGGTQDNGTLGVISDKNWSKIMGGDGFSVIVDPDNPNIIYGEYYYGNMFRLDLSTGASKSITAGIPSSDRGLWHSPFVMDVKSRLLYHGRASVYVSFDRGDNWIPILGSQRAKFSAIAVSHVDEYTIWAGCANGDVFVTNEGGDNWQNVSQNGLISRYVTDIETSYFDKNTAYVTFSGYGTPHIFKTTDLGRSWQDISKGLPDAPFNAIAIHPFNEKILFAGSDVGVFATYDGGESWFPFGVGLPNSPVVDLVFHMNRVVRPSLTLRAATHGRSIWEIEIPEEMVLEPTITSPAGGEIVVASAKLVISWYGFSGPVKIEFSPNNGIDWNIIADNVVGSNLLWNVANKPSMYCRIRISSGVVSVISNTFTIVERQKGSVLSENSVAWVPYGLAYDGEDGLWTTSFYSNKLYKLNIDNFTIQKEIVLEGDSLFTDLTIDRANKQIYIHRMNNTSGGGGKILVYDFDGKKIRQMNSPAVSYPIGLELVGNDLLLVGDRDGSRKLYLIDKNSGTKISEALNPFQKNYGPRGLCYDGYRYVYQASTDFSSSSLSDAFLITIDINNLSAEVDRMRLSGNDGLINARGVEIDPRDGNYWISDFGGSIYKIASSTITSVEERPSAKDYETEINVYPNPTNENFVVVINQINSRDLRVELVDNFGRNVGIIIDSKNNSSSSIREVVDVSSYSAGVYYIVVYKDGRFAKAEKLIIYK